MAAQSGGGGPSSPTDDTPQTPLQAAAAAYNVNPKVWMLTGGDDHALVACLPDGVELPDGFLEIGRVSKGAAQVTVDGSEPEWLEGPGGFTHFA